MCNPFFFTITTLSEYHSISECYQPFGVLLIKKTIQKFDKNSKKKYSRVLNKQRKDYYADKKQ